MSGPSSSAAASPACWRRGSWRSGTARSCWSSATASTTRAPPPRARACRRGVRCTACCRAAPWRSNACSRASWMTLEADGAVQGDLGLDMRWYHFGGYKRRVRAGLPGVSQTRPLLERHVRRRCLGLPQPAPPRAVRGRRARRPARTARPSPAWSCGPRRRPAAETVAADLVVDATGRGSRAGDWLEALGYERPPETAVRVDVSLHDPPLPARPDGFEAPRRPAARSSSRGRRPSGAWGSAFPVEGGRWMVTLVGWVGEAAPAEEAGFLEYARSLPVPDILRPGPRGGAGLGLRGPQVLRRACGGATRRCRTCRPGSWPWATRRAASTRSTARA